MATVPFPKSAPKDIPARLHEHDHWIDEPVDHAQPFSPAFSFTHDGDSFESGPSSYLQTPPSDPILHPSSPPTGKFSSSPHPNLQAQLDERLATLAANPTTPVIDLLTAGVGELAHALDSRELTSVRAIKMYLSQIERLNGYLHALTYVAGRDMLLEQARECDRLIRSEGFDRRQMPLCGIPVVVK
jgi:amidase